MSIGKTAHDLALPKPLGRPKKIHIDFKNKDEQIECCCGVTVKLSNANQHKKSNKHKLLMDAKTELKNNKMNDLKKEIESMTVRLKELNDMLNIEQFKLKF